jgi:hypothetical protein
VDDPSAAVAAASPADVTYEFELSFGLSFGAAVIASRDSTDIGCNER